MRVSLVTFLITVSILNGSFIQRQSRWGFFAHKQINRLAVYSLPPEMIGFYRKNIYFVSEWAAKADQRRYAVEGEAECHFIDLDRYGDSALAKLPKYWQQATSKFEEDSLRKHGVVPWHIQKVKMRLTEAFEDGNYNKIIKLSADLGHYIADANVPLHTTSNYNGQFTNQHGIHAFWESRLPELFSSKYDFFTGPAIYLENSQLEAWEAVRNAHLALDSVLSLERKLTLKFNEDKKYSFEQKNGITVKVYSKTFSKEYHNLLAGQVERRMKASVKMVADFWYTAWVDAGQPDLSRYFDNDIKFEDTATYIRNVNVPFHDH